MCVLFPLAPKRLLLYIFYVIEVSQKIRKKEKYKFIAQVIVQYKYAAESKLSVRKSEKRKGEKETYEKPNDMK